MKPTDMEYTFTVARLFSEALGRNFDLPLYVVGVASNPSVIAERIEGMGDQRTLSEHYEGDTLEPPINLFVVDCKGRHLHEVLGEELLPPQITYPASDRTH